MLIYEGNEFKLYPYKVKFTDQGEEFEDWSINSLDWWKNYEIANPFIENVEIIEIPLTKEMINRYEEVKSYINEMFIRIFADYIYNGSFPKGANHPLTELQNKKEKEMLYQEISEREIKEIEQGQHLSDLEIRMLMRGF